VPLGLAAAYRKFHRGRAKGSRGGGSIGGDEELSNCVLKRILQRRTVARFRNGRFVVGDSRDPPRRIWRFCAFTSAKYMIDRRVQLFSQRKVQRAAMQFDRRPIVKL